MENYFEKALSLMQEGEYDEAASELDQCIKTEPYNSEALYYQAVCFRNMRCEELALDNINKALDLSPVDTEYLLERAYLYNCYFFNEEYALRDFEAVLKTDVSNVKACKESAEIYMNKKNFYVAAERYTQALSYCSDEEIMAEIRVSRGYCNTKNGNYKEAEIDFIEAEERKKGDFYFHYHRANLYNSEEKFSEAAAEFKKAILAEPNNSSVYADLAEVYLILGDTDKALWASECSVRLGFKGKAGVYTGIIAYELCGILDGQLPLFKYAEIWQFPEDVDFHKMRAFICFRNGLFREAVYSLKKAAALDKNPQGYFYFNMGLCYTALGDIIKTNNCMIIAESLGFKPAHEVLKENFLIN